MSSGNSTLGSPGASEIVITTRRSRAVHIDEDALVTKVFHFVGDEQHIVGYIEGIVYRKNMLVLTLATSFDDQLRDDTLVISKKTLSVGACIIEVLWREKEMDTTMEDLKQQLACIEGIGTYGKEVILTAYSKVEGREQLWKHVGKYRPPYYHNKHFGSYIKVPPDRERWVPIGDVSIPNLVRSPQIGGSWMSIQSKDDPNLGPVSIPSLIRPMRRS